MRPTPFDRRRIAPSPRGRAQLLIGITSQHALYHIRGLASKGLVRLERKGVRLRCFSDEGPASPPRER